MNVDLRIKRFDPERDERPHWEDYRVEVEPGDRVLDALHQVRWYQDGSLAFRRSCAHGVCGSDAMVINGENRLACVLLISDVGHSITVEPLRGLPVLKDLVGIKHGGPLLPTRSLRALYRENHTARCSRSVRGESGSYEPSSALMPNSRSNGCRWSLYGRHLPIELR